MKKSLLLSAILLISIAIVSAFRPINFKSKETTCVIESDFCNGWEDGYCEGWKDVKGQFAVCPVTPICPIPEIGKDNYRGGYNRGFKAGSRAASND